MHLCAFRRISAAWIVLSFLGLAVPAAASDTSALPTAQEVIEDILQGQEAVGVARLMARDRADSNCIGDLSTPLCAFETLAACHVRDLLSLCRPFGELCLEDENCECGPIDHAVYRVRRLSLQDIDETATPAEAAADLNVTVTFDWCFSADFWPKTCAKAAENPKGIDGPFMRQISVTFRKREGEWKTLDEPPYCHW